MNGNPGQAQKEAGDLLLAQGKLTEQQLEQVRRRQRRLNLPQHRAIVDLNFASEEDTWRALAAVNHLEFLDPVAMDLNRQTLDLVPIKFILHYHLLPVGVEPLEPGGERARVMGARDRPALAHLEVVLEAQQELYPTQRALVQNQVNELISVVLLYRALGGGWEMPVQPSEAK